MIKEKRLPKGTRLRSASRIISAEKASSHAMPAPIMEIKVNKKSKIYTASTSIIHDDVFVLLLLSFHPCDKKVFLLDAMTFTNTTSTASGSISQKLISVNTLSKCPSIPNTKVGRRCTK
jgi:hypothetical protein